MFQAVNPPFPSLFVLFFIEIWKYNGCVIFEGTPLLWFNTKPTGTAWRYPANRNTQSLPGPRRGIRVAAPEERVEARIGVLGSASREDGGEIDFA